MNEHFVQAFWLAGLQGLTEFLPISSSGHLILAPKLLGWRDQGLAFDIAAHFGTLLAVVIYFHADLRKILAAWGGSLRGKPATVHSRLAWSLCFATLMVGLAGVCLEELIKQTLRAPIPVALATLGFGVLLALADWRGAKRRNLAQLNWKDVLVIGGAQTLALIPGASRAGLTISAGLAMGLTREAAARFSFLLAIPVIALAGIWQSRVLFGGQFVGRWQLLFIATLVSAAVALLCIHWLLSILQHHGLLLFALYRVVLGVILLLIFL